MLLLENASRAKLTSADKVESRYALAQLLQLLRGSANPLGLWLQGTVIQPDMEIVITIGFKNQRTPWTVYGKFVVFC